jgi:hypothetical protein
MPNELRPWKVVSAAFFIYLHTSKPLGFSSEVLLVFPPVLALQIKLPSFTCLRSCMTVMSSPTPSPSVQHRRAIEASAAFFVHQLGSESRSQRHSWENGSAKAAAAAATATATADD